ncbi:dihydrofolate reductase family protein [Terrimonas sp. NA20]|uniref:Dihydrofolate reductase family protein n=1 Tax=Terrimonas ginsenosidimutans TaxID=2908004 RepID=A0ABS9L0K4_9BACT|nr:dihydrofolate reductase family protein [Terrimonas ginsenosidimutans]MCG2618141.1 dihydrofolate reductase family protein [Terrimonas ginsenosidimutans]
MRKLIFEEFISLDGLAADENGSTSFFESATLNKHSDEEQLKWLDTIDTILLGANTYEMFVQFWPTDQSKGELVADKLNTLPKLVFSKRLKEAPWGNYEPAQLVDTDAAETVRKLKLENGKDMVLWGSISLAQSLMKADLIDEYRIRIVPVVLGKGRPLFENSDVMDFQLDEVKKYESGLLLLKYRRKASVGQ